ncbi:hypothetical protein GGI21_001515 [Coemansia aciculifera]|nr:hypothetical protein GGI21_001515 [Coemansia aciculifera]
MDAVKVLKDVIGEDDDDDDSPLIVAGDLNCRLGAVLGDRKVCDRGKHLSTLMYSKGLDVFNRLLPGPPMPTYSKNALDKPTEVVRNTSVIDLLLPSKRAKNVVAGFHLVDTYSNTETETTTKVRSDHRALAFNVTMSSLV